jgi:hypothetical protein
MAIELHGSELSKIRAHCEELHGSELSKIGRIVKKVALYILIYLLTG